MKNLDHIESLSRHGAQIRTPDGLKKVDGAFYQSAIDACNDSGANAICYELVLPGIEDEMMLAIHRDGHVDSGSKQSVLTCLDR